jgi:hypothetical protein
MLEEGGMCQIGFIGAWTIERQDIANSRFADKQPRPKLKDE